MSSIWSCDSASPSRSKAFPRRCRSLFTGRGEAGREAIGEGDCGCTCGCTVGDTDADRDCNCRFDTRVMPLPLLVLLCLGSAFAFPKPFCSTELLLIWAFLSTPPVEDKKPVFTVGAATHHSRGALDTRNEDRLPPSITIEPLSGELEL